LRGCTRHIQVCAGPERGLWRIGPSAPNSAGARLSPSPCAWSRCAHRPRAVPAVRWVCVERGLFRSSLHHSLDVSQSGPVLAPAPDAVVAGIVRGVATRRAAGLWNRLPALPNSADVRLSRSPAVRVVGKLGARPGGEQQTGVARRTDSHAAIPSGSISVVEWDSSYIQILCLAERGRDGSRVNAEVNPYDHVGYSVASWLQNCVIHA
jgi:hypothetical protein